MFMRAGAYSFVKPFHNGLGIRKITGKLPQKFPYPKRNCELMRAKLPHDMPRILNRGKSRNLQMVQDA
jgi:hypothetical protein